MTYNRTDPHHNKQKLFAYSYRKLKINGTGNYHLVLGKPNFVRDRWENQMAGSCMPFYLGSFGKCGLSFKAM